MISEELLLKYGAEERSYDKDEIIFNRFNHSVKQKHFGIWLNLWFETIDEYFMGQLADRAKNNARKMASHLFMSMYKNR